jgi:AcrR family transcriptional regulator
MGQPVRREDPRALTPMRPVHSGRGAALDDILLAGYRLIERDGVLELNMRELIAEAGTSNRAFYRYFASKDEFLMTLVDALFTESLRELSEAVGEAVDPVEKLTTWINSVLDRALDPIRARLGRPFVVHGARLGEQFPVVYASIGNEMIALAQAAIEEGVREGGMTSPSPRRDAHMIFDLTMAVTNSHVLARAPLGEGERAAVVSFALRALRVDEATLARSLAGRR